MKDEQRKVPKIRFKGFTDAWEQRRLEEQVNFFNGLTYKPADVQGEGVLVIRSSNIQEGRFIDADNVYVNREVVNVDTIRKGDIVVVVRNGSRKLIGKHAILKNDMPNAVIGAFMTGIRTSNSRFINALLSTKKFEKEVEMNMGATINQITGYMFAKMEFRFPSNDEASKVGMVFEQIDNLITLHQRKVDKLKDMKKTLLQKMFPKNNQTVPDIRFQGFTDAWEQRKLDEIAEIIGGGTPSTSVGKYWDGTIDWYTPAEITDKVYVQSSERKITEEGLRNSSAKMLPPYKTVLFTSRAGIGKTAILEKSSCTNQGFQSLVLNNDVDTYFIYSMSEFIKEAAEKVASGSTFAEISGKGLGKLKFLFAKYEEQHEIGEVFKNLDNLITLHQRKVDQLKEMKKTLLGLMFV